MAAVSTQLPAALRDGGVAVHEGTPRDAIDGQVPVLVAEPRSTEQVSAVMTAASRDAARVAVAAGRSKQTWGRPVGPVDLLVDLSGMDAPIEHQPGDLIASAQAGMPLAALQERLAPSGQRLGIDEMVPGTTVGGLIATNPSGPRRLHTGTVRDLLIGLTVVRADGRVAKAGGKVVKNVAGYDLCKLMTGAFGTLGIVTEATFRLHPVPPAHAVISREVPADRLADVLADVVHSQLAPSAIEIDARGPDSATVAVLLEGTPAGVDSRREAMLTLVGADARADGDFTEFECYPFELGGTQVGFKLTGVLSQIADLARAATRAGLHVRGSAGTGVLYAAAPVDTGVDRVREMLETLRPLAARAGGGVTVVDGPRDLRDGLDVFGPVHGLPVMRRIKDEFDPDHRLQAGRFAGGI